MRIGFNQAGGTPFTRVLAAALCALAVGFGGMSSAEARDEAREFRGQIEELNATLTRLETHDFADEAAAEFGQARLEVAEAQGKITAEDYARARIILMRLESRLMLAESILDRATIEQLADQRETELFEMMTEADAVQVELEAKRQRRQELQDDVTQIISTLESQ